MKIARKNTFNQQKKKKLLITNARMYKKERERES